MELSKENIRVYISTDETSANVQLVDRLPDGLDEFTQSIKYDSELRVLATDMKLSLTFRGLGYKIIREAYLADGYCQRLYFELQYNQDELTDDFVTIQKGYIRISDCNFDLSTLAAECNIEDASYGAWIAQNKNIPIAFTEDRYKTTSGTAITPISFELFNSGGTYAVTRVGYKLDDVLSFMVKWVSDNQLGFYSQWYTDLPSTDKWLITSGRILRLGTNDLPLQATFVDMFSSILSLYNLGIGFDVSSGVTRLRLETAAYFENTTSVIQVDFDLNEGLFQTIATQRLYGQIVVGKGGSTFDAAKDDIFPNDLAGFESGQFVLSNQCNIDTSLNISPKVEIDSNLIRRAAYTDTLSDGNDDKLFLIQYTPGSPNRATKYEYFSGIFVFNEEIFNQKVIDRYSLASDAYLSVGNLAGFIAKKDAFSQVINVADATKTLNSERLSNTSFISLTNWVESPALSANPILGGVEITATSATGYIASLTQTFAGSVVSGRAYRFQLNVVTNPLGATVNIKQGGSIIGSTSSTGLISVDANSNGSTVFQIEVDASGTGLNSTVGVSAPSVKEIIYTLNFDTYDTIVDDIVRDFTGGLFLADADKRARFTIRVAGLYSWGLVLSASASILATGTNIIRFTLVDNATTTNGSTLNVTSAGSVSDTINSSPRTPAVNDVYIFRMQIVFNAPASGAAFTLDPTSITLRTNNEPQIVTNTAGGNNFQSSLFDFLAFTSITDWVALLAEPQKAVTFNDTWKGWSFEVSRKLISGETNFKLLSNKTNTE